MQCLTHCRVIRLSIHFPLTREDLRDVFQHGCILSFNPLPSHEGRQHLISNSVCSISFNPLPSHEGRHRRIGTCRSDLSFQSTSLSRGKTGTTKGQVSINSLSIHFPLTREDVKFSQCPHCGSLSIHFPLTREDCKKR